MLSRLKKLKVIEGQNSNPYEGRVGLVYARVSSKRQEIEGSGLISQEGRCLAELKNLDVQYHKTFSDSWTGGGDFMERPAMRAMLGYIDSNPHKKFLVIFDDLKRFARNTEFHLKLKTEFKARNVTLKCLNHNFDDSPTGKFVETVLAAGNELERHQNRLQVIQKQKIRLELGYWAFGSKKGYKMTKDSTHGMLSIPTEEGMGVLKTALEGFASGEFVRKIDACQFLIQKGFWKRKYASAYIDKFTYILKDPFYMGDIEYLPWEVTRRKGKHQGIISAETFDRIQIRLGQKGLSKRIRKDTTEDFPLRGLLLCSSCGYHLTGAWSRARGKLFPYYFCQNGNCEFGKKSIRKKVIKDQFQGLLEDNKLRPEVGNLIKRMFDDEWDSEVSNLKAQEKVIERKKKEIEEKIEKLTEVIFKAKSEEVRDVYEKQLEKYIKELENCEEPVSDMDLTIPYQNALDKALGLVKSPYSTWEKLPVIEKHKLFYFLFEEKLAYSKKEGYRNNKLPYAVRIFEEFATSKPLDVEMVVSKPRP